MRGSLERNVRYRHPRIDDDELVASADVVWHLDAGRLVEVGPPHDLLAGDGPTARLLGQPQWLASRS